MSLIDDFRQAWADASAAKGQVMEALGYAKLAELKETDPEAFARLPASSQALATHPSSYYWGIVEAQGMTSGIEGKKKAEARAIADQWCDANAARVAEIKSLAAQIQAANPLLHYTDQQACVPLVDAYRLPNLHDAVTEVEMYLISNFEPQSIGGAVQSIARIRPGGAA